MIDKRQIENPVAVCFYLLQIFLLPSAIIIFRCKNIHWAGHHFPFIALYKN